MYLRPGEKNRTTCLTNTAWPYGDKKVVVLSRKGISVPAELKNKVSTSSENPTLLVNKLSTEGTQHIYIDGGKTIQSFLSTGLVDEITITVIPILLGTGLPLFGHLAADIHLKHISTNAYPFGFVQSKYCIS
ncbi:MAG: dihydrofolate reductase, partial [bacterium]|nr:dihydrofolate reductase [bacterium]